MLRIKDFKKKYQGNLALEIPELEIPPGIHWVQGKNGSGKSTLFRALSGIIPSEGEIWLNDTFEINRDKMEFRLRVNYGEAEPNYPPFLNGAELIDFVARAKKASPEQVLKLGKTFGTLDFEQKSFQTYSSGMLKKTSLVLAFLGNPVWIFLDEPLITLDKETVGKLTDLIAKLNEQGTHFLLSSHEESALEKLHVTHRYLVENQKVKLWR
jgi:ABC-2 type transport system ATP-binding protein